MAEPSKVEIRTTPEASVVLEAGKLIGAPRQVQGYKPYTIVGDKVVELNREEPTPLYYVAQLPQFRNIDSFLEYVERFKDSRTQLFADERAGTVTAVLDYHVAATDDNHVTQPQRCAHIATFTAEASDEWAVWKAKDAKQQSQEAFAAFVEENLPFFVKPAGADMLEIASSFQASSEHTFNKAIRLDNGQVQFQYMETINGMAGPKGSLEIPKVFNLQLRPFLGCEPYPIEARLRYRIESGRLSLWYELVRPADIQRDAFAAILLKVGDESKIKPYLGKP